jgi:hypothetical protein
MYADESDFFFGTFLFKLHEVTLWDFSPSGAVTVSSQPSYFPDGEFDIKKEGGFILRTSPLTS